MQKPKTFVAVSNSTIFDICLNTYGSLNFLAKLMDDNNFDGADTYPANGQIFLYDESLVNLQTNQSVDLNYSVSENSFVTKYTTRP